MAGDGLHECALRHQGRQLLGKVAPAVRGARPYILHEAPFAKLFTDTVIVRQRHHAADDIGIPGGGDGSHGGIGNQRACDRSTHEHQLPTQSLSELRSGTARASCSNPET